MHTHGMLAWLSLFAVTAHPDSRATMQGKGSNLPYKQRQPNHPLPHVTPFPPMRVLPCVVEPPPGSAVYASTNVL
jgi:hypothetical protein